MSSYSIRSLTHHISGRGDTTITAAVHYDTGWRVGLLTHHFTHTPGVGRFGTVHVAVDGKHLGDLRDPDRFGDTFDDQWVSNYLAHRNQNFTRESA